MKQIVKNFLKAFRQIGEETIEKSAEEGGKIAENIITGKALLGDIATMSDGQYKAESQKYKNKDEEEMAKLRQGIKQEGGQTPGRNVEAEIKQVQQEQRQKEEDEQRFLVNLQRQREQEKAEMAAAGFEQPDSKRARGKQGGGGKKKKQQPSIDQMSQTQEIKGKID